MLPRAALALAALVPSRGQTPQRVARFGIITDVHFADYQTVGTRHYRDSLPKVERATRDIIAAEADFMIELGDFKDTVCPANNKGTVPANCTDKTLGFIDTIEGAMAAFKGPRFHVLGNHDVDILNQSAVRCISPPIDEHRGSGHVQLEVSNNAADFSDTGALFEYQPVVTVHALVPSRGAVSAKFVAPSSPHRSRRCASYDRAAAAAAIAGDVHEAPSTKRSTSFTPTPGSNTSTT